MPSQTFTNGELAAGRTEIHDEQRSNSAPTKRSQVLMDMATSWYDMGTLKLPQHLQKYIDQNGYYVKKLIILQPLK